MQCNSRPSPGVVFLFSKTNDPCGIVVFTGHMIRSNHSLFYKGRKAGETGFEVVVFFCPRTKEFEPLRNSTLFSCKNDTSILFCFGHKNGRLITWVNTLAL